MCKTGVAFPMLHGPGSGTRPETGPMCFGDDWPGVFIRGDNAYGYITCLKGFLELHPPAEGESVLEYNCRNELEQLIGLLHSSNVSPRDPSLPRLKLPIQRMRDFVEAKEPKRDPSPPLDLHRLTVEKLLDEYARIERTNKRVVDIWMCEAHFDDVLNFAAVFPMDSQGGSEVRYRLWGAVVHVSGKIPLNTFVILGAGDAGLVDGVVPHEVQLTRF